MIKALYILAFVMLFGGLLFQFAALKTFNFVIPKDSGSEQIGSAQHYGIDPDQTLYVFKPTTSSAPLPTLIFVHGGSWEEGNAADYKFVGRAFAAQGFLTLVINYRARPSNVYPAFIEDVALATAWANNHANEFGGDGKTIFLVGHSAGAYNIAMAVLNQSYLKNAGVAEKTIRGIATLAGPFDFLPLDAASTILTFGQVTDLPSTQPINYARADAPPFLILHGSADTTVFLRNPTSLRKHLNDAGAHPKYIEYKGLGHVAILLDIAKPLRGRAPVLEDVTKFFKDILKQ